MSPHAANSLVHDLVQMAQAMEQLPQVQLDLSNAHADIDRKADHIQRLELKLIDRANEIDNLNQRIRELEVAKDEAETMFLEAEDRTTRATDFVKNIFGSAGSLIQALEPPKPQPTPEPTVEAKPDPMPEPTGTANIDSQSTLGPITNEPTKDEGVSVQVDPTTVHTPDSMSWEPSQVDGDVSTAANTSIDGPYTGLRYYNVPNYISRGTWIHGGGTEADYDWRPTPTVNIA